MCTDVKHRNTWQARWLRMLLPSLTTGACSLENMEGEENQVVLYIAHVQNSTCGINHPHYYYK